MRTFIRNINTGSYIARCANRIPTGTHVIYADKDGVTHNAHGKYGPVLTRDQHGIYR